MVGKRTSLVPIVALSFVTFAAAATLPTVGSSWIDSPPMNRMSVVSAVPLPLSGSSAVPAPSQHLAPTPTSTPTTCCGLTDYQDNLYPCGQGSECPTGNCTWYAAFRRSDIPLYDRAGNLNEESRLGYAYEWLTNARGLGYSVCEGATCRPFRSAIA